MVKAALLGVIVLVVGLSTYFGFQPSHAGQPSFLLIVCLPNVLLAVAGLVYAYRDGVLKHWFGMRGGDFSLGFLTAGALFGGAWAFTKMLIPPTSPRAAWLAKIYLQTGEPKFLRGHVAIVVLGLVGMAVCEEVIWRGLVVSLLEERVGSRRAWLYAPVLYALAHVPAAFAMRDAVAGPSPLLPVAALACGLVWGYLNRKLGRLTPGIFSHGLFLWCMVMMFRLWGPSI